MALARSASRLLGDVPHLDLLHIPIPAPLLLLSGQCSFGLSAESPSPRAASSRTPSAETKMRGGNSAPSRAVLRISDLYNSYLAKVNCVPRSGLNNGFYPLAALFWCIPFDRSTAVEVVHHQRFPRMAMISADRGTLSLANEAST